MEPILVPHRGTSAQWFSDPNHCRVYSGADYNARCVAAIGPADFSRVMFAVTSNPRQKANELARKAGTPLIVHECLWSMAQKTQLVMSELMRLLDRPRIVMVDGWVTIPKDRLVPLMELASRKVGVESWRQCEFERRVLDIETAKLQAQLARANVAPAIVAAHRVV